MVGYVECGKRVVNLMKEILTFNDDNSKTAWMTRVKLVSEFINAIHGYYDGYRSELEYSFNQKQTARELNFTTQISDNQNLKKSIEGSLSRYNNELESLHQRRVELIDLRDVINNDASLTEEIKNVMEDGSRPIEVESADTVRTATDTIPEREERVKEPEATAIPVFEE